MHRARRYVCFLGAAAPSSRSEVHPVPRAPIDAVPGRPAGRQDFRYGDQWREDFGLPEPLQLLQTASVWLLYYPGSVITKPGASVIGTWADPRFWSSNRELGITLLHTNPTERAGGIRDREFTRTIDGWFDRIGLDTAPELGTEDDFKQLVANAN
jgi:hypothetical protein